MRHLGMAQIPPSKAESETRQQHDSEAEYLQGALHALPPHFSIAMTVPSASRIATGASCRRDLKATRLEGFRFPLGRYSPVANVYPLPSGKATTSITDRSADG